MRKAIAILWGAAGGVSILGMGEARAERAVGIDVSAWQGNLQLSNWQTIAKPVAQGGGGKQFAFIRSTRGGTTGFYDQTDADNSNGLNTESQRYDDPYFVQNMNNATAVGMLAGPYHFLRADILTYTSTSTGQTITMTGADEATHMLQMAGSFMKPGYLLPVLDLESGATQRSTANLSAYAVEFGRTIFEAKGVWPIVYSGSNYANAEVNSTVPAAMPNLWLARWPNQDNPDAIDIQNIDPTPASAYPNAYGVWNPSYPNTPNPHPWKVWQYTSRGRVPGIGGGTVNVDLDVANGDVEWMLDNLMVPALWQGDASGAWTDASKWNSNPGLPGPRDIVQLNRTGAAITVTVPSGTHTVRALNSSESIHINGGSLLVNKTARFGASSTLSAGTLASNDLRIDPGVAFTQSGGTVTTPQWVQSGVTYAGSAPNAGTYNLTGGTFGGALVNTGTLNYSGGSVTGSITNTGTITFGSGSASNNLAVGGGFTQVSGNLTIPIAKRLTANGPGLTLGDATVTLNPGVTAAPGRVVLGGDLTYNGTGSGATITTVLTTPAAAGVVDLGSTNRVFNVGNGAAATDLLVNAPLVSGTLTKTGAGTMAFGSGVTNALTGGVTVGQGVLLVTGNNQLGPAGATVTSTTTVITGGSGGSGYSGTIQLSGGVSYGLTLRLTGAGANGLSLAAPGSLGALDNASGTNTWAGSIVLAGTGTSGTDPAQNQIGASAGTLVLSGAISEAAGVSATWTKSGARDVVLTGPAANTYRGLTRLSGGRLIVEKDGALGAAGSNAGVDGNTFLLPAGTGTLAFRAPTGSGSLNYNTVEWLFTGGTGAPGHGQVDSLGGTNTFVGHVAIDGPSVGGLNTGSIGVTDGSLEIKGGIYARSATAAPRGITKVGAGTLVLSGDSGPDPAHANAKLLVNSTVTVSAGAVVLKGTAGGTANVPGVTSWRVNTGATLVTEKGGAFGAAVVTLDGGTVRTAGVSQAHAGPIALTSAGGTVDTAGSNATFAGGIGGSGALTKAGAGTLTIAGAVNTQQGGSWHVNQGTMKLAGNGGNAGVARVNAVSVATAAGARLDLNDNGLIVDYAAGGGSPLAQLAALVAAAAGPEMTWLGPGITSTAAQDLAMHRVPGAAWALAVGEASAYTARTGSNTFAGQIVDTSAVLVRYTYAGDATMNGIVDDADVDVVVGGYGTTGGTWAGGDLNYDTRVDDRDLDILVSMWTSGGAGVNVTPAGLAKLAAVRGTAAVPEPGAAAAALGLVGVVARRRRR